MTLNLWAIRLKGKQPWSTPALKKNKRGIKVQLFQRKLFVSPARLLGHFGNELLIRRGLLQYRITQDMKKNRSKDFSVTECFSRHFPTSRDTTPMLFSREYFSSAVSDLTLTFSLCVTVMLNWKCSLSFRISFVPFYFSCSGSVEECVLNLSCPCLGFTLKDLKLVGKCCVGTLGTLSSLASV